MSDDNNESYHCLFYDEIFQLIKKYFYQKWNALQRGQNP